MHAVVALGGDADPTHVRRALARAQLVIAADGGAAHIEAAGGVCDVIVGDMDSVSSSSTKVRRRWTKRATPARTSATFPPPRTPPTASWRSKKP